MPILISPHPTKKLTEDHLKEVAGHLDAKVFAQGRIVVCVPSAREVTILALFDYRQEN